MSAPLRLQPKWIKSSQIQSLLLLGLFLFFIAHFVLLSPSGLEEDFNGVRVINPRDLLNFLKNESTTLISTVPTQTAPSYSLRDVEFFSSTESRPNWKLIARKSNVYQEAQLIHGRDLELSLPDHTIIKAKEGVLYIQKDRGELFGEVEATFPDGTIINSDYALVISKPTVQIEIPAKFLVKGRNTDSKTPVFFESQGVTYMGTEPKMLHLISDVHVTIHSSKITKVHSDHAIYQQESNHLSFAMNEDQPLEKQFVKARQTDLSIDSRLLEVDIDSKQKLQTITAVSDVFIRDSRDPLHETTATSGKALYHEGKNEIHLEDFPQVYQDKDTVTGDRIIFNRTKDTIEVKQSNAIYKH